MKIKAKTSRNPYAIPIEMRPLWRICFVVISIAIVSGNKRALDIKKVNILIWMLIRHARWNKYESFLTNKSTEIPLVSVDTATYRAIEFSIGKGFVKLDNSKLSITGLGGELFELLERNNIMQDEREFLQRIGKKLTEKKVKKLTGDF